MKTIVMIGLSVLMWSGQQALAACIATVTASTPTADFIDHGNGTVTHSKTGLMWKRCSQGQTWSGTTCTGTATTFTWQQGLQDAMDMNNAGGFATFTDWRLPNLKEFSSIVEDHCITPAINITIFPATASNTNDAYWSSTPSASMNPTFANFAWRISFFTGVSSSINLSNFHSIRLVRGGF